MLPDGSGGLEDVEVLEDVWDGHEPHGAQESEADPSSVEVDRDKGGRDGEVVDEGVELKHEPELVAGSDEPYEEVDHEEDVEGKVDLLQPVLAPGHTLLNSVIAGWI